MTAPGDPQRGMTRSVQEVAIGGEQLQVVMEAESREQGIDGSELDPLKDEPSRVHGLPGCERFPQTAGLGSVARRVSPGVFRRICGQNGGLVVPRQTHSVRVCSPPSRRVAPPPLRGATAWTPAPRTRVPALVVLLKEVWVG